MAVKTKAKKEKLFNGKPMSHWRRQADELVMLSLVRAMSFDTRSLPGKLAYERLEHLAKGIDPVLYAEICDQRETCRTNLLRTINNILS